jgi:uncharacterized protein GlcG (DUF336 family)
MPADGFIRKVSVTHGLALRMVEAGFAKADQVGRPAVIAVLDEGGHLVAFGRQEGAPLVGIRMAQRKARTALDVGVGTQALWDSMAKEDVVRVGLAADPEMLIIGGGLPIVVGGQLAGSVGVSGGHWSEDVAVAEAALAILD